MECGDSDGFPSGVNPCTGCGTDDLSVPLCPATFPRPIFWAEGKLPGYIAGMPGGIDEVTTTPGMFPGKVTIPGNVWAYDTDTEVTVCPVLLLTDGDFTALDKTTEADCVRVEPAPLT